MEQDRRCGPRHADVRARVKIVIEAIFEVPEPAKPGYIVAGVPAESASGASSAPVEEALPDCGTVLPKASVADGQTGLARAASNATISPRAARTRSVPICGASSVVRAPAHPGFDYSERDDRRTTIRGPTTSCSRYLKSPAAMVPGTKMTFAGLPSAQDRINLHRLSAHAGRFAGGDPGTCAGESRAAPAPAAAPAASGSAPASPPLLHRPRRPVRTSRMPMPRMARRSPRAASNVTISRRAGRT